MARNCFYVSIHWGQSSKHKLLLICGLNRMARRKACRPSKMQTCLCCFFIIGIEKHDMKGAFTGPWAQLSQAPDLTFCQNLMYLSFVLALLSFYLHFNLQKHSVLLLFCQLLECSEDNLETFNHMKWIRTGTEEHIYVLMTPLF